MLNLTLVQKLNLIINTCLLFEMLMYITRGVQKSWLTILCNNIKRKNKSNKRVTRTEDCLASHFPLDYADSSEAFSTQFYIWQKLRKLDAGYAYGTFCPSKQNWKCSLLRQYLNFLCELNFVGQHIFNVSPWTRIVRIFTHETHQPTLTWVKLTHSPLSLYFRKSPKIEKLAKHQNSKKVSGQQKWAIRQHLRSITNATKQFLKWKTINK